MTKTNPRKIPRTEADVRRAREEGRLQGMTFMLTTIIWILCDKHDAPDHDLKQLSEEVAYLCDNIVCGNVSFAEVRRALEEEHDWRVNMYMGKRPE